MYNLFSIFIERFTIFTVLIFVILKNLMVFISPPLWTLWNYKKQKLRDGLIIAIGSLPHPFCTCIVVVDYYPYPAYPSLARALKFFNLNSPTFAMNIQIDSAF